MTHRTDAIAPFAEWYSIRLSLKPENGGDRRRFFASRSRSFRSRLDSPEFCEWFAERSSELRSRCTLETVNGRGLDDGPETYTRQGPPCDANNRTPSVLKVLTLSLPRRTIRKARGAARSCVLTYTRSFRQHFLILYAGRAFVDESKVPPSRRKVYTCRGLIRKRSVGQTCRLLAGALNPLDRSAAMPAVRRDFVHFHPRAGTRRRARAEFLPRALFATLESSTSSRWRRMSGREG